MKQCIRIIYCIYENLVTALFALLILFVLVQVFARYVLSISIPWTEELARYVTVFVAFLGGAVVSREGDHLGAYFLRDMAGGRMKSALYVLSSLFTIIFQACMLYGAYAMYKNLPASVKAATMTWFSMHWLYLGLLFGLGVMLLYSCRDLVWAAKAFLSRAEIDADGRSSPFAKEEEERV